MFEVYYYYFLFSLAARNQISITFSCFERLQMQLLKTSFTLRDLASEINLLNGPIQINSDKGCWPATTHLKYFVPRGRVTMSILSNPLFFTFLTCVTLN